jgi:hypothetical protein
MTTTINASTSSGLVVTPDNSGNVLLQYNGVAAPAFSGGMSTSVNIPTSNVWTKMPCDYEAFDTANCFDITTNKGRFTPTVAGYYQLNASVQPNNSISRVGIAIYKNGSAYQYGTDSSTSTGVGGVGMSTLVYMNGSTDYVEVYAAMGNCPQPWAYSATALFSWFNGYLVRGA